MEPNAEAEVIPIDYNALAWAVKLINRVLMQRGVVLGIIVDSDNKIRDASLLQVNDAINNGFKPVQLMPKGTK